MAGTTQDTPGGSPAEPAGAAGSEATGPEATAPEATADADGAAAAAARAAGLEVSATRHGRVNSLAEAAAARGIDPRDLIKTLVIRRSGDDHVFVLVPGDRTFSWPKLRALLGTNRLSMPDAAEAKDVTGYERGTITPFGSARALPVYADREMTGRTISIGGGAHGVGLTLDADEALRALDATVADLSDPPVV
ncbi:aminoacyl-tRNA deacylase [Arthrobacter sp. JSM 101049]|uniref:aminoacyl-tRNA deacylase n=1 Tax=Arthrobacter sp. JSM 101049 TaxID=929097 RepID=UPI0035666C73